MTTYEKKPLPLGIGDEVKTFDDGTDGYPEKWVNGTVTEIGDESFSVLWDDFKEKGWETEYEWAKVTIEGGVLKDDWSNNKRKA